MGFEGDVAVGYIGPGFEDDVAVGYIVVRQCRLKFYSFLIQG